MSLPHSPPGNPSSLSTGSGLSSPTIGFRTPALPVPTLPGTPIGRIVRSPPRPIGYKSTSGSPLSPPRIGFGISSSPGSPSAFALHKPLSSSSPRSPVPQELLQADLGQPHLVTLVLLSKKALQHGEHLCTLAHTSTNVSFQTALDVLALDAKVKWLSGEVLEQLKLAADVARSIEEKRTSLLRQADEWDSARSGRTTSLDNVLDALGKQLVPPEFHEMRADSDLFGSQHGFDSTGDGQLFGEPTSTSPPIGNGLRNVNGRISTSPVSPSATIRRAEPMRRHSINVAPKKENPPNDKRYWKTLRDFLDDQSIEETLDLIEEDKIALDNILASTDEYPETLYRTIATIEASLPSLPSLTLELVQDLISAQETRVRNMAGTLVILANHYDNMATALRESESGEVVSEEEMQSMSQDTEELKKIMLEMEKDMENVEGHQNQLTQAHTTLSSSLSTISTTLNTLDNLSEILEEMISTQDSVEHSAQEALSGLQHHLITLEELHRQFEEYRRAFDHLLVEIQRRTHYRDAVEEIVKGMGRELIALSQEEARVRASFNAQYGSYLPEDLCLCIGNTPTKYEIVPFDETSSLELELGLQREARKPGLTRTESLPFLEKDLVDVARERLGIRDPDGVVTGGTESL